MFKAGNSTFLMFSNFKNKMPNIRFFPPFFPFSLFLPEQTIQLCTLQPGRTVHRDSPC